VFSGIGIAFVWYLAAVNTILKDQIKRPTGELLTPIFGAVGPHAALALDKWPANFPTSTFLFQAAKSHPELVSSRLN
jgi:hypothetical protein